MTGVDVQQSNTFIKVYVSVTQVRNRGNGQGQALTLMVILKNIQNLVLHYHT